MTVYASRISKHTRLLSHPFSLLKHTLGPLLRTSIITSNTVDVDDHSASVINLSCVLLYRIAGYIESAFGGRGVIGGVGGTATVNSSSTTILFLLFSKSFPTTIQWITHIHEFIHIMIVIFTESSSKTTTLSSQFSLTSSSTHHHNHHHHRRPSLRRGRSRIILSHAIIPQWVQWALSVQHIPKMCQVFLIPVLRLLVIQPDSSIITGDGNGGRGEGGDGDDDMTNHDTAIALVSSIVMNSGGAGE